MPLAKQILQFVFGATDQDTSKKSVRAGDLIEARNVQQIKASEHSKREGFTATAQTYEGLASIQGESLASPDGLQVITRDAVTDSVFTRSTDVTHNKSLGASLRYLCKAAMVSPAIESGAQTAPMAKQAGRYRVWLKDEQHLMIEKMSANGTAIIEKAGPIAVNGVNGSTPSTHVKSFAVVDSSTFDSDALWVFWVDWTDSINYRDSIWAMRFLHSDIEHPTGMRIATGTPDSNKCLASISAGVVGSGRLTIVAVGNEPVSTTQTPLPTTSFRSVAESEVHSFVNWGQYQVISGSASLITGGTIERTSTNRNWVASGACLLNIDNVSEHTTGGFSFTFWGVSSTADSAALLLYTVEESTGTAHGYILDTFSVGTYNKTGRSQINFIGATTGKEIAGGAFVAGQCRVYFTASGAFYDPQNVDYPDKLYTKGYTFTSIGGGTTATTWIARGAWLAHGYLIDDAGHAFVITGWQDPGEIQIPYHLRRLDTGSIVAQFARGEGPFAGGCSTTNGQIASHISDINQPVTQQYTELSCANVILSMQSANISGSADVASVSLERPTYQDPANFREFVLYPGPIPSIASGRQQLQEGGPLSDPPRFHSYWGEGSS